MSSTCHLRASAKTQIGRSLPFLSANCRLSVSSRLSTLSRSRDMAHAITSAALAGRRPSRARPAGAPIPRDRVPSPRAAARRPPAPSPPTIRRLWWRRSRATSSRRPASGPRCAWRTARSHRYVLTNGYATIKRLKEELTAEGYDVEEFNKVGELKAIRRAVDDGTVDGIFDKVWYNRAVEHGVGVHRGRPESAGVLEDEGVNVKTLADLDKITAYMVKKYGKDDQDERVMIDYAPAPPCPAVIRLSLSLRFRFPKHRTRLRKRSTQRVRRRRGRRRDSFASSSFNVPDSTAVARASPGGERRLSASGGGASTADVLERGNPAVARAALGGRGKSALPRIRRRRRRSSSSRTSDRRRTTCPGVVPASVTATAVVVPASVPAAAVPVARSARPPYPPYPRSRAEAVASAVATAVTPAAVVAPAARARLRFLLGGGAFGACPGSPSRRGPASCIWSRSAPGRVLLRRGVRVSLPLGALKIRGRRRHR